MISMKMSNYLIKNLYQCNLISSANAAKYSSSSSSKAIQNLVNLKEAPIKSKLKVFNKEKYDQQKKMQELITIENPMNLSRISGVPKDHIESRLVRIYKPSKNVMQSGTNNVQVWRMEFEMRERWENPLMGWTSSADPLSNLNVQFVTKEEAVAHCEKNGWKYIIDEEQKRTPPNRSYGANFSWNKKTRVSTK